LKGNVVKTRDTERAKIVLIGIALVAVGAITLVMLSTVTDGGDFLAIGITIAILALFSELTAKYRARARLRTVADKLMREDQRRRDPE
jgi:1,4-dihydroxy-2-naphthoate octaprenyltransferase